MKPKILVTREVFDDTLAYLGEHCEVEANQGDNPFDPVILAERLKDKQRIRQLYSRRSIKEPVVEELGQLRVELKKRVRLLGVKLSDLHRADAPAPLPEPDLLSR